MRRALWRIEGSILWLGKGRRLMALAGSLCGGIALFGILGAFYTFTDVPIPWFFNLGAEYTLPAMWSGALLLGAGGVALLVARAGVARGSAMGLAVLLFLMAGDEVLVIHEALERRSGVDWQILYAPIVLVAAFSAARMVRDLWRRRLPSAALVAGAIAWGASQLLEAVQWDGDEPRAGYASMMVAEELLEMSGSALFLIGFLGISIAAGARAGPDRRGD